MPALCTAQGQYIDIGKQREKVVLADHALLFIVREAAEVRKQVSLWRFRVNKEVAGISSRHLARDGEPCFVAVLQRV